MSLEEESRNLHAAHRGKIELAIKIPVETKHDLSLAYTPGVGHISTLIAHDPALADVYTNIGNTVAVVTDGSAVLGLGNIGPRAAMPVMEGKALLFKRFANVDAVPLCLDTQDPEEIIRIVTALAPTFAGINLEDIAAPHCFQIEKALQEKLSIPVFHDDQHGTAIVVLAGLLNALKVCGLDIDTTRTVINGAGAAGLAIFDLLWEAGFRHITVIDSKGALSTSRTDLHEYKKEVAEKTQPSAQTLNEALQDAHVFIGVSGPNLLNSDMVRTMHEGAIIFAMANPVPEIYPEEAFRGGARIVATGRSDFPNQINNALVFPGLFRGALDTKTTRITTEHMIKVAHAVASLVVVPTESTIIPDIFHPDLATTVAEVFHSEV
jgi:malate dehydrogenase (oxaloacetate-decarboxylating)